MGTVKRIIREKELLKIKNITAKNFTFCFYFCFFTKGVLKEISLRKYNKKTWREIIRETMRKLEVETKRSNI